MRTLKLGALFALLALNGCAGLMEFHTPKEFEGGKVKEDPPGTMLPPGPDGVRTC
jgi:hypothetical protein